MVSCPLSDPDVGPSVLVCDVEQVPFHYGLYARKFVMLGAIIAELNQCLL